MVGHLVQDLSSCASKCIAAPSIFFRSAARPKSMRVWFNDLAQTVSEARAIATTHTTRFPPKDVLVGLCRDRRSMPSGWDCVLGWSQPQYVAVCRIRMLDLPLSFRARALTKRPFQVFSRSVFTMALTVRLSPAAAIIHMMLPLFQSPA